MINRTFGILVLLLAPTGMFANTITISTAASSASGWSYNAGTITASANVTINNATIDSYLLTGNLTIEAGTNIVINGDINPSPGAATTRILTLRAGGNIVVEASRTISCSTGSLHIVCWSDTDKTNGGFIYCKSASVLDSKGGHIWMGGGDGTATWNGLAVGDGLAKGSSVTIIAYTDLNSGANSSGFRNGITFYNNSILSKGGDIALNGQGAALSNAYGYMGLYMGYNATVSSGAGNISIDARTDGASSVISAGWFYGILMIPTNNTNNGYGTTSIESTSGNITINASARHNQNVNHNAGLAMFTQSAAAVARVLTYSGNIDITGTNLNVSNPSYGGIFLTGAGDEMIVTRSGNITLRGHSSNSSVAGINVNSASRIGYDGTNACTGNIELISDAISFSSPSAALQSTGELHISPATGSRAINIAATGGLALSAGFFTGNCINGFSSIKIGHGSYSGNINIAAVTFQDDMVFETTGAVTQSGAITANGEKMTFLGTNATYTLSNTGNSVRAATGNTGSILYFNSTALELGPIATSGTLQLATLSGDLTITGNIQSANTGTDAIRIYADYNKPAGDETGGNIIVSGSPLVSTGTGGRSSLYSGRPTSSTGLVSLVGGTANTRTQADATTTTFTPALGAGIYALFRASASTLPVSLMQLNAQCRDGKTTLSWSTATEAGNQGFYIEKSADGREWQSIGFVEGAGDSYTSKHYQFEDNSAVINSPTYRLKQVDRDGQFTYSKTMTARCNISGNRLPGVQAVPNPTNRLIRLKGLPGNKPVNFSLYNMQGIVVKSGLVEPASGSIHIDDLTKGSYFLSIHNGNVFQTLLILKQ